VPGGRSLLHISISRVDRIPADAYQAAGAAMAPLAPEQIALNGSCTRWPLLPSCKSRCSRAVHCIKATASTGRRARR